MAVGRAGSSVTWDTISRLVGKPNVAYEYTGGSMEKSERFFQSIDPAIAQQWASLHLCEVQHLSRVEGSGIAGFQWKPYFNTFRKHPMAFAALQEMSERRNPRIRIIYLTRNALDREISNIKHRGHIRTNEVPAHCPAGDEECAKKHAALGTGVFVPTDKLVNHLRQLRAKENEIIDVLGHVGIKFISIKYEKLYDRGDNVDEWKRIFRFLERGPTSNLTIQQVHEAFSMERTSSKSHKDIIANYDEVKQVLTGTEFEQLLH